MVDRYHAGHKLRPACTCPHASCLSLDTGRPHGPALPPGGDAPGIPEVSVVKLVSPAAMYLQLPHSMPELAADGDDEITVPESA